MAVVERTTTELLARRLETWPSRSPYTVEREEGVGFALVVRHLERMALGTPYTTVVKRVWELEVLLEAGDLKISRRLKEAGRLARELTSMRMTAGEGGRWRAEESGEHDDLAMAVGLACRRAPAERSGGGRERLPGI